MLQEFINKLYRYKGKMGLLIGKNSIELLSQYIYGAADAFAMCGYSEVLVAFSNQWWDFIDENYSLKAGTGVKGWFNIILEYSDNEEHAIDTFYELLKNYIKLYYPMIMISE